MESFTSLLSQDLKFSFLQLIVETLKAKATQKINDEEDSIKANAIHIKGNTLRASQFQFLIKLFIHLIESLGPLLIEKFTSATSLVDAVIPYLSYSNLDIQICTAYSFNYLVDAYPRSRAQIISRLLNLMTMARGELATSTIDTNNRQTIHDPLYNLNTVRGCSFAISVLVQNVDFELKSVPFDIINSVFDHAKSMNSFIYSL